VKKRSPARSAQLLLLLALVTAIAWWFGARQPTADGPPTPPVKPNTTPSVPSGTTSPTSQLPPPPSAKVVIDPALSELADSLHAPESPPEDDLRIIESFLQTYSKAKGGHPIGENADITAALTGSQGHRGRVFPPAHRTIREGQLVDRWGTPLWFHPNSGHQMEIRSAGPDRQLFTADDIVRNPSPEGLGSALIDSPVR
jgi:hypothetical protein